jgi:cell shape-determining protein MreC
VVIFAPHIFSALFTSIARPFWHTEFSIGSGSLRSPENLLIENASLKEEVGRMQVLVDTIAAIEQENKELKGLLGRELTATTTSSGYIQQGKLSAVLRRPPFSPYDEIIIDIGSDQGVSTTSLIYAHGSVLIGRVIDVLGHTSKVRLFSSPGEQHEILIGSRYIPATAVGRGGGQYEAQVSRDMDVIEGDIVVNPSLDELPFGIVSKVLSDPAQPFITILFAPPVNMYQLRWVTVKI